MTMSSVQRETIELLEQLAPQEGYTRSQLDAVRFMRSNRALSRTPVLYEPCIVIVCQGCKRGYLADKIYTYNAQHYLVLSVPLPFSTETDATPQEPLLAVAVRLEMTVIAELVLALDGERGADAAPPEGILSTPLNAPLADTTLRLLRALSHPQEAHILGPAIVKELYYRVLMGEQGGAIRAALASFGQVQPHLARAATHSRRLRRAAGCRNARRRSRHERARLSRAFQSGDQQLARAVHQSGASASGAAIDDPRQPQRRHRRVARRL